MIEILSASALATVQDLGRTGALQWGVGTSGAMDPLALAAGNLLLGNDEGAAAIEVPVFPFELRFTEDCAFALTGADCAARLDGLPLLPWWAHQARAGQTLQLGVPLQGRWRASRAYLCLPGGVDVPQVLGSRSTQLRGAFGGHEGRALRRGDRLRAAATNHKNSASGFGLVPPALALPLQVDGVAAMRVLPAAEYPLFTPEAQQAFWRDEWKITSQSDRYGYRLAGTPLEAKTAIEMRSHGIVPGVIQVPPSGEPIIQLADGNSAGGYPKIGVVIEADLWRIAQAAPGNVLRFVSCTLEEAHAAEREIVSYLLRLRRLADYCRFPVSEQAA